MQQRRRSDSNPSCCTPAMWLLSSFRSAVAEPNELSSTQLLLNPFVQQLFNDSDNRFWSYEMGVTCGTWFLLIFLQFFFVVNVFNICDFFLKKRGFVEFAWQLPQDTNLISESTVWNLIWLNPSLFTLQQAWTAGDFPWYTVSCLFTSFHSLILRVVVYTPLCI